MRKKTDDLFELDDLLTSIVNRCLITKILIKDIKAEPLIRQLLPTLLEDNFEDCMKIVEDFCVVDK